ncbi:MAG: serine/threonine-protein kinase [Gemmataceae bacterium]|nr:serine/threonine-protein kinase [Gemmataceae bacterium]
MTADELNEEEIFDRARRMGDTEDRCVYLDKACGDDQSLRKRIDALLRIHDQDRNFLEQSVRRVETPWTVSPGSVIGPYSLHELIGEGGMGVVFRAEQTEPIRRVVALKIIKPGMGTAQVVARLERERQALALMDHPNIARILDAGVTGGRGASATEKAPGYPQAGYASGSPYFAMELIHGIPITNYCDEHQLTPRQRVELFIPVCQAVQHAHQKGIIHRDIKPSNVLVTQIDGRAVPKIIDFGVAKALDRKLTDWSKDTNIGAIIGTLEYMSPEQAVPSEADVDTRSDIYSLGVLLYELLTGTTPLQRKKLKAGALLEALRIIREEEPQKPSTRISTVDELPSIAANRGLEPRQLSGVVRGDLDWIVMKSLEKDRNRRYQTANGLARELQRHLCNEPVEARPPNAIYRFGKWVRRNRAAFVATAACVAVLLGATSVSVLQAWRATRAETASRKNEEAAVAAFQRAEDEAAITKAVNQFLRVDLLQQADIGHQPRGFPRDKELTVRKVLDRAAERIDQRFVGQELTEAAIRWTVGDAYSALGEFPRAAEHLRKSLEIRKRLLGDAHADTLISMASLGQLERQMGHFDEAELLTKHVYDAYKSQFGEKHPRTLSAKQGLGILYSESNKYNRGQDILEEVLEDRLEILGPDNVETLNSMTTVADSLRRRRESKLAEPLARTALEGYRKLLGPDHYRTLLAMTNLAKDCSDNGRHEEAEKLLRESYDGQCSTLGTDHPLTLNTAYTLAILNTRLHRWEEADARFRQALTGLRARFGNQHSLTLQCMRELGLFYCGRRRFPEAEMLQQEILTIRRAKPGSDPDLVIRAMVDLGETYVSWDRPADAEPLLQQAIDAFDKRMPISAERRQSASLSLAVVKLKLGHLSVAESLLQNSIEFWRDHRSDDTRDLDIAMTWMASVRLKQDRPAEAETLARETLSNRLQNASAPWVVFDSQTLIGRALAARKQYAEAEPWLVKGIAGLMEQGNNLPFTGRDRLAEGLTCLVQMYDEWGKPGEAAKWRKEVPSSKP